MYFNNCYVNVYVEREERDSPSMLNIFFDNEFIIIMIFVIILEHNKVIYKEQFSLKKKKYRHKYSKTSLYGIKIYK